jgi:hypothetical protein
MTFKKKFILFICAYNVWVISPPLPLLPPLPPLSLATGLYDIFFKEVPRITNLLVQSIATKREIRFPTKL